ncbi:MAG: ParA family protein [Clostridia bacterium]|nr:ParA family protein [Clostridia bacterium]
MAKTTSTYCFAAVLKSLGHRVLVIDMDPQMNVTLISKVPEDDLPRIYQVMVGEAEFPEAIRELEQFDIVPGSILMSSADKTFPEKNRNRLLKLALEKISDRYDYVVIDTPPSMGLLTVNAFAATNDLIIPAKAEILALSGIKQIYDLIREIKKKTNPDICIRGILFTQFTSRTNISSTMMEMATSMSEIIHAPIFETKIRSTVKVQEAQAYRESLFDMFPSSTAAEDYKAFVKEYLEVISNG